jgi:hypothetical protein
MIGATVPGAFNAGPTPSFSVINPPPAYAPTAAGGQPGAPSTSVSSTTSTPVMGPNGPFAALGPQLSASAGNSLTAGQQALTTSMDPQQALYDRTLQQTQQQQNAAMQSTGMAGSPYGAGIDNQALTNFNIGWQDTQLGRQATGIEANAAAIAPATGLYDQTYGSTTSAANTTAGLPNYPAPPAAPTGLGGPTGALPSTTGTQSTAPGQTAVTPPGQPPTATPPKYDPTYGPQQPILTAPGAPAAPGSSIDYTPGAPPGQNGVLSNQGVGGQLQGPAILGDTPGTYPGQPTNIMQPMAAPTGQDITMSGATQPYDTAAASPPGSTDSSGQPSADWVPQSNADVMAAITATLDNSWWTGADIGSGGASGY